MYCGIIASSEPTDCCVCASGGVGGVRSSVCLRGLAARRLPLLSTLVPSGSVLSGLPQSSMPACSPQFSVLLELSTVVFRVRCGTVIYGRIVGRVRWSIHLFSRSPQQKPASPYRQAHSRLPKTVTQLGLPASSFALARLFRH